MVMVNFISPSGAARAVEAEIGRPLMQAAVNHDIPGILAECGGSCSCATCHDYVDEPGRAVAGARGDMEEAMLEFADDVREESRLSCQIKVTAEMEGMTVRIAPQP